MKKVFGRKNKRPYAIYGYEYVDLETVYLRNT